MKSLELYPRQATHTLITHQAASWSSGFWVEFDTVIKNDASTNVLGAVFVNSRHSCVIAIWTQFYASCQTVFVLKLQAVTFISAA